MEVNGMVNSLPLALVMMYPLDALLQSIPATWKDLSNVPNPAGIRTILGIGSANHLRVAGVS